ncbi:MAG: hypothetical protein ACOZE5_12030 [Verrucomicrobiota bacterium]
MRRHSGIILAVLLCAAGSFLPARAQVFAEPEWAIEARFPGPPKNDGILTPSPQGDVKVRRFFFEQGGQHFLLARFEYPMAMLPGEEPGLYDKSIGDLMKSRPGQMKLRERFTLGAYDGERIVVAQRRERSVREVRFVAIASVLYMMSVEWPEQARGEAAAAQFFDTVRVAAAFQNAREVALAARWRELVAGNFRLRYDATRWYRDPTDAEPGIFNLLRTDQRAEAQFIAEAQPVPGGDIERAVLDTAREGAESVTVRRRGRKLRGSAEIMELEFAARVERASYINHGYFYSGPEGSVQLRGWSEERDFRDVAGDISELLDGLTVTNGRSGPP